MNYYLTVDDLKANTELQQHVDPYLVVPSIAHAQLLHIEPLLGGPLAQLLNDQLNTDPQTVTDLNEELLLRIRPALAWWSLFEAIPNLAFKFTSQGVEIKSGKNGVPASARDIEYIRGHIRKRAEDYTVLLRDFLLDNKSDYPLYPQQSRSCGPESTRSIGGIALPPAGDLAWYYRERDASLYRKLIS